MRPGTISVGAGRVGFGVSTASVAVTVTRPAYPPPPAGVTLNADDPDVSTMYNRLSGYYGGREPLQSMAYFCLTMLERHFTRSRREAAADFYNIDTAVLDEIGRLSSTKGGATSARKAGGLGTELSHAESRFLEAAVK